MTSERDLSFQKLAVLHVAAELLLGARAWGLLMSYGKLMDGPHAGSYVSGIPLDEQLELVQRLVKGDTLPVHLMHRHRSGCYEVSWLRWSNGSLVMVFKDREVIA